MRKDNPAKLFLRRYISLSRRVDALQRAIDSAFERAANISVSLKEVKVLSSPAAPDRMAQDVTNAVDACKTLYEYKTEAETALRDILTAIESVKDERGKTVLTMRYITGDEFRVIAEKMHYSEPAIYIIHGRALIEVNRWIERRADNDTRRER